MKFLQNKELHPSLVGVEYFTQYQGQSQITRTTSTKHLKAQTQRINSDQFLHWFMQES